MSRIALDREVNQEGVDLANMFPSFYIVPGVLFLIQFSDDRRCLEVKSCFI
jgi:hypothetical protein